jgi:DNA-binding transcriptional LysR family regulator
MSDLHSPPLRTFVRVVERGSLSAAARDLGLAQSSVSRQLRELEQLYGCPLLLRTTRATRLTDAGEHVYEHARHWLSSEQSLRDRLRAGGPGLEGTLRLTAPSAFGALLVTPFCAEFARRHAGVSIDIKLTDRDLDLVRENLDVALRIGKLPDSGLVAQPLGQLEEVAVVHPTLVAARRPEHPEELAQLPWVGFSGLRKHLPFEFVRGKERASCRPPCRFWTDSIVSHREALLSGAGAGVIHRYVVADALADGRLVELLPAWQLPLWPLWAVQPRRGAPVLLQALLAELPARLARLPGWRRDPPRAMSNRGRA